MKHLSDSIPYVGACVLIICLAGCGESKRSASEEKEGANAKSQTSTDAVSATNAGRPELRVKWPQGKAFRYKIAEDRKLEIQSPFRPEPRQRHLSQTREIEVSVLESSDTAGAKLGIEVTALKFRRERASGVETFDSGTGGTGHSEGDPELVKIFGGLVGERVIGQAGSDGRLKRIEAGAMVDKATLRASGYWRGMAEALFDSENLSFFLSPIQARTNRLTDGMEWEAVFSRNYGRVGELRGVGTYQVETWTPGNGTEKKSVMVAFDGSLQSAKPASGKERAYKLKDGSISGQLRFDPYKGRLISSEWKEEMTFQREVPMPPGNSGNGGERKRPTSSVRLSQKVTVKLQ